VHEHSRERHNLLVLNRVLSYITAVVEMIDRSRAAVCGLGAGFWQARWPMVGEVTHSLLPLRECRPAYRFYNSYKAGVILVVLDFEVVSAT